VSNGRAGPRPSGRGARLITRIGLLADSHGRVEITRRAGLLLLEEGAQLLLHLGDLGSAEVLAALAGLGEAGRAAPPVRVVFGNIDQDPIGLRRKALALGISVDDPVGELVAAGKRLVFLHGHRRDHLRAALLLSPDYLCHGHTHRPRDERLGATRFINPGALFRARSHTVGLLDLKQDWLKLLEVPDRP
jgi:putative phosphoesterase